MKNQILTLTCDEDQELLLELVDLNDFKDMFFVLSEEASVEQIDHIDRLIEGVDSFANAIKEFIDDDEFHQQVDQQCQLFLKQAKQLIKQFGDIDKDGEVTDGITFSLLGWTVDESDNNIGLLITPTIR